MVTAWLAIVVVDDGGKRRRGDGEKWVVLPAFYPVFALAGTNSANAEHNNIGGRQHNKFM